MRTDHEMRKRWSKAALMVPGALTVAVLAVVLWLVAPHLPDVSTVWSHVTTTTGIGPAIIGVAAIWGLVTY